MAEAVGCTEEREPASWATADTKGVTVGSPSAAAIVVLGSL